MNPALPDLLLGLAGAISAPAPPEAGGDYAAARLGLVAMLLVLAAQEAERGPAARQWENEAIAALLVKHGSDGQGPLATDAAMTWSALDAQNAELRRGLIALHERAEAQNDQGLQRTILALYQEMADSRRLTLG